jgi:8-oxo-dGTP pyrophosphatase MutT (NUDIX family)/quercetin dioxygenase-like cupin family protein
MFKSFKNDDILKSLEGVRRQYLVGDLKNPQVLDFLRSERLEIGITHYDTFNSEEAHRHVSAIEYQYVVAGRTQYMETETKGIHEYIKGDFYAIMPDTAYAQRSQPGTTILFIKVPSINDKQAVEIDQQVSEWLKEKLTTVRKDYYYDSDAPKPNSIKPAAAVAIISDEKNFMLKRKDSGNWTMPGGTLKFGESLPRCAVREVEEESGLKVELTDIIGVYTDPNILISYSDGEVRQEFTVLYLGSATAGTVSLDDESTSYAWVGLNDVLGIQLADSQRKRLEDVLRYWLNGKRKVIDYE